MSGSTAAPQDDAAASFPVDLFEHGIERGKAWVEHGEQALLKLLETGGAALQERAPELKNRLAAVDPTELVSAASDAATKLLDVQKEYVGRVLGAVFRGGKSSAPAA